MKNWEYSLSNTKEWASTMLRSEKWICANHTVMVGKG